MSPALSGRCWHPGARPSRRSQASPQPCRSCRPAVLFTVAAWHLWDTEGSGSHSPEEEIPCLPERRNQKAEAGGGSTGAATPTAPFLLRGERASLYVKGSVVSLLLSSHPGTERAGLGVIGARGSFGKTACLGREDGAGLSPGPCLPGCSGSWLPGSLPSSCPGSRARWQPATGLPPLGDGLLRARSLLPRSFCFLRGKLKFLGKKKQKNIGILQKERFLAESRADRACLCPACPSALQAGLLGWRNDVLPERMYWANG